MNNSFCIAVSMRKKAGGILSCLFVLLLLASCQSYKKVPYLQDSEVVGQVAQQETLYDARIMPKDQLTVMVSCTNPELVAPFNLGASGSAGMTAGNSQGASQSSQQTYLVDNEGNINFPVLGTLKVGGLTKKEVEQMIVEKLKPYIKETPIVTARMVNYKISVLGEVAAPGTFTISNEKVNLLEALAMAGDMTIYGIRDNVKLIRESADYYWLQQNDIVYVTPNKAKARNSDISNSTSLWFSATSVLVSLTSLLVNIFR